MEMSNGEGREEKKLPEIGYGTGKHPSSIWLVPQGPKAYALSRDRALPNSCLELRVSSFRHLDAS
jgi:hypothetical protein